MKYVVKGNEDKIVYILYDFIGYLVECYYFE